MGNSRFLKVSDLRVQYVGEAACVYSKRSWPLSECRNDFSKVGSACVKCNVQARSPPKRMP